MTPAMINSKQCSDTLEESEEHGMLPFSYTSMKLIHDEDIREALERYRFYTKPKIQRQGLLQAFSKALARFTQYAGKEPDPAKWETEMAIGVSDQS